MALIATPGASNANSYCTLQEADAYNNVQLSAETWQNADSVQKEAAIRQATLQLDHYAAWQGKRSSQTQALAWPRTGVLFWDSEALIPADSIPQWLKDATAEMARTLLANPGGDEALAGISRVRLDDVSIDLTSASPLPLFSSLVQVLIAPYVGSGAGLVKRLVRM